MAFLHISAADVAACAVAPAAINDAVEAAFRAQAAGHAATRPTLSIPAAAPSSFRAKGGVLTAAGYAAVKWYGYHPQNPARGLPEYRPLILLSDAGTGAPLALIDGTWITTVRTAAITAVGASLLANPGADTLTLVGSGTQARANLHALLPRLPLRRVRILGNRPEPAEALAAHARTLGLLAETTRDPQAALAGAAVVVTTVPRLAARTHFLDANGLAPGAFVSMVDSGVSWDAATLDAFDTSIADDAPTTHREPGDAQTPTLSLADAIATPARRTAQDRIALIFSGTGLADAAAAAAIYETARAQGRGQPLTL